MNKVQTLNMSDTSQNVISLQNLPICNGSSSDKGLNGRLIPKFTIKQFSNQGGRKRSRIISRVLKVCPETFCIHKWKRLLRSQLIVMQTFSRHQQFEPRGFVWLNDANGGQEKGRRGAGFFPPCPNSFIKEFTLLLKVCRNDKRGLLFAAHGQEIIRENIYAFQLRLAF